MGVPYAEVIGDPIAHSKSPLIHRFWLQKAGLEGDYRRCLVRAGELGAYFEERGRDEDWRGCNITMPHKLAAVEYAQVQGDPSFPAPGINVAAPAGGGALQGLNTDVTGLIMPLMRVPGLSVGGNAGAAIVVGAGGVLFSVMSALSSFGFAPIIVVLRDREKARAIERDYRGVGARTLAFSDPLPPARILVNASPLGMAGYPDFPLPLDSLDEEGLVFDLVYNPAETSLLSKAKARRLRTIDGLAMLVEQAAPAFQLFFGVPAPREHDEELRELLTS